VRDFLEPLGPIAGAVERRLAALDDGGFAKSLWEKDPSPWAADPATREAVSQRLGWLSAPSDFREKLGEVRSFVDEARADGLRHALLIGMGGSSLAPEVFRKVFGVKPGWLDVQVLDSTDPAAIRATTARLPLDRALVIVASKSGSTIEVDSLRRHLSVAAGGTDRFVAITDPGTELAERAKKENWRHCFLNPPDVGGRFSALTWFGLLPAALLGVDVEQLLDRTIAMAEACGPEVPATENPGLRLGAALGEAAMSGRDKMTLALPPRIAAFGAWIEQLVAESTGKKSCGLLPVDGEPLGLPAHYGRDRVFVHLKLGTTQDDALSARVAALSASEHPTVHLELDDPLSIGAEMLRWEIAVATASAVLGVNAFDEPDVKLAKTLTARQLDALERRGRVEEPTPLHEESGVRLFADDRLEIDTNQPRLSDWLEAHLRRIEPGDYLALLAYVRRTDRLHHGFERLRATLRDRLRVAVTVGYGPRYLHSTGQFHKGGPNRGVFLMLTHGGGRDLEIPGRPWSFSQLESAQAAGDYRALCDRRRRVLRLHFGSGLVPGLPTARAALDEALRRINRGQTAT